MLKNKMKNIVLGVALTATSLLANSSDVDFETKSLIGIEGGYNSIDYVYDGENSPGTTSLGSVGIKIGAETKDIRIFLSTRYLIGTENDYDYIATYGGEFQYKINPSKMLNFFIGFNAGVANIQYTPPKGKYRTLNSTYIGGDIGTNIHLDKSVDLEFGARIMNVQDTNTIDNIEYKFNNIVTGYASIIYKWKMD
jgi:hypothetical protein